MKRGLTLLLVCFSLSAQAIEPGQQLESFTLEDQFGETATLDDSTRLLLVASSRAAADVMDEALAPLPADALEARRALYVADISRVPGLIARMFMVPAMRSADYRVLLDRESRVAPQRLGAEDDGILWLKLDDGKVIERRLFEAPAALRGALEEVGK